MKILISFFKLKIPKGEENFKTPEELGVFCYF